MTVRRRESKCYRRLGKPSNSWDIQDQFHAPCRRQFFALSFGRSSAQQQPGYLGSRLYLEKNKIDTSIGIYTPVIHTLVLQVRKRDMIRKSIKTALLILMITPWKEKWNEKKKKKKWKAFVSFQWCYTCLSTYDIIGCSRASFFFLGGHTQVTRETTRRLA